MKNFIITFLIALSFTQLQGMDQPVTTNANTNFEQANTQEEENTSIIVSIRRNIYDNITVQKFSLDEEKWENVAEFGKYTPTQQTIQLHPTEKIRIFRHSRHNSDAGLVSKFNKQTSDIIEQEEFTAADFSTIAGHNTILTISQDGETGAYILKQTHEREAGTLTILNLSSTMKIKVLINDPYEYGYLYSEETPTLPAAKIQSNGTRKPYVMDKTLQDNGTTVKFLLIDKKTDAVVGYIRHIAHSNLTAIQEHGESYSLQDLLPEGASKSVVYINKTATGTYFLEISRTN